MAVETGILALAAFLITVVLVLWRPGRMHEAVPALIGAFVMFLAGLVDRQDVLRVTLVVWNSAMTIISTFIMATVLEGAGFFRWVTQRLTDRAGGNGRRLFHLVLAFSACLTLFLNNDGSILLGTPIVLVLVRRLRLPRRAAFGYLLGACVVASAASPPIGVSNMANLEAMSLVGISLVEHLHVVLIPALLGLAACWLLLYAVFIRDLPVRLTDLMQPEPERAMRVGGRLHPLRQPEPAGAWLHWPGAPPPPAHRPGAVPGIGPREASPAVPDLAFMWFAVGVVVLVRLGFFVASSVGLRTYVVAIAGAVILLGANLYRNVVHTGDAFRRAPWAILGFAFGMDLVVFGLRNAGITGFIAQWLGPSIRTHALGAAALPGLVAAATAALLNNHPGLIISSLSLTEIANMTRATLDVAYASVVLGTDLGALLTPIGTLASLLWFHILREEGHRCSWWEYLAVSMAVVPLSFIVSLLGLFVASWLMGL